MAIRRNRPVIIFLFLFILVLLLTATSVYFYRKATRTPKDSSVAETQTLVAEVGKIVYLPANETPTIATVSDPSKLNDQAFFVDAKKGDKVLIYTEAKKAILYDPTAKKIVNMAPVDLGASGSNAVTIPPQTPQQ